MDKGTASNLRPEVTPLPSGAADHCAARGSVLASWVREVDSDGLSSDELLNFITALEMAKRELEAVQLTAVAAFAERTRAETPVLMQSSVHEMASAELGLELQMSPGVASARLVYASRLVEDFPGIRQRLAEGGLDEYRARLVCEIPPVDWSGELCAAYEARMLAEMDNRSGVRLKNLAKRVIVELDPDQAQERRRRTIESRTTMVAENHPASGPDTASFIVQDIDAVDALAIQQRLGAIARGMKSSGAADGRSMDQLRADAAVSLLLGRLPHIAVTAPEIPTDLADYDDASSADLVPVAIPGLAGPRPADFSPVGKLHVIIPLSALPAVMGGASSEAVAEIPGYGPIQADAARALAAGATSADSDWIYTLTDDDGEPVAHGETKYRPSKRLRNHVDARDRTCRFPHCNRPAVECDADHTRAHHKGGPTEASNLAALCRRHHRLKQHPKWRLAQPRPGILEWTTPRKRVHTTTPDPYPTQ